MENFIRCSALLYYTASLPRLAALPAEPVRRAGRVRHDGPGRRLHRAAGQHNLPHPEPRGLDRGGEWEVAVGGARQGGSVPPLGRVRVHGGGAGRGGAASQARPAQHLHPAGLSRTSTNYADKNIFKTYIQPASPESQSTTM